jgi:hypothetical protein
MSSTVARPANPLPRRLVALCVTGVAASWLGLTITEGPVQAAGFAVTTTADGGAGSLRDAITQANANPGADVITVPAGTYTLTIAGSNEDNNATGDLDINGDTTIVGAGSATTIIDADGLDRVFHVRSGSSTLQSLTITGGDVGAGSGGNIFQASGANLTITDSVVSAGQALNGGGVAGSAGTLTIDRTEIINNTSLSIQGNGSVGAGISKNGNNSSFLVLTNSLIANNNATGGNAGGLYMNGNATVSNTTFTGNSASGRTVMFESYNANSALTATLTHVTIAGNTATGNLGGLALYANVNSPGTLSLTVSGSLFQNNLVQGSPANCAIGDLGTITSGGHNLTDDATCGFAQSGDLANNNATTLGALANNGGPTRTMALGAGSSAIDAAGACSAGTPADQRGAPRPVGTACDMGAYEAGGVIPSSSTTTTTTVTTTTTTTVAGGGATTTTIWRGLPATGSGSGSGSATGLWLATLACSLGGLLILVTRRLAR